MHKRPLQQGQFHDRLLAGHEIQAGAMSFLNLVLAGRLVVAWVLAVAGARKLGVGGRAQLTAALGDYAAIPDAWVGAIARVLPWLELSLGVLLAAGVLLEPVSLCASLLLGGFAVAVAWEAQRGRSFKCGCGSDEAISWWLAARDLTLTSIAAAVAAYPHAALAVWVGPGRIEPAPGSPVSLLPVPMTVLVLGMGWRLIRVGSPLRRRNLALDPTLTIRAPIGAPGD